MKNGFGSYWLHETPDQGRPRSRLEDDAHAEVTIVGAGFTGLWTAYWLKKQSPSTSVIVLEKDRVGFGASGRNGGWITGKTVGVREVLAKSAGNRDDVLAMERRCHEAVFEIADVFEEAGIDIDAARGGWMQIARTDSELQRLRNHIDTDRDWGLTEDEVRLLSQDEAKERINVPGVKGAMYSPFNVRANPAKMSYGLAHLCEELGVKIYENSAVTQIREGVCRTERGSVTSSMVVLATEAYTAEMPGLKRSLLPMFSSMVVTEPLSEEAWADIGWQNAESMSGAQHMYFYSQRTADGRIALGGRGDPYRWGSRFDRNGTLDPRTQRQLMDTVQGLFPHIPMEFAHAWCGVLGVPRDWSPFVDVQHGKRLVRVGGYVGQGVTASYVAGLTVADLLNRNDTQLARSPWVRTPPRQWEPEPVRWIGSKAIHQLLSLADRMEHSRGGTRTAAPGVLAGKLMGR